MTGLRWQMPRSGEGVGVGVSVGIGVGVGVVITLLSSRPSGGTTDNSLHPITIIINVAVASNNKPSLIANLLIIKPYKQTKPVRPVGPSLAGPRRPCRAPPDRHLRRLGRTAPQPPHEDPVRTGPHRRLLQSDVETSMTMAQKAPFAFLAIVSQEGWEEIQRPGTAKTVSLSADPLPVETARPPVSGAMPCLRGD